MNAQLNAVAESQGQWSATANALKKSHENARRAVFVLSTAAAAMAAVSSQLDDRPRQVLAIVSTVCMAIVTVLTARMLDSKRSQAWVRARAASEGLKREGFRHAAQAAPYDNPATRDALLRTEAQKIETEVDDLIGFRAASGPSSNPRDLLTPSEYIERRPTHQFKNFYEPKATAAQAAATKMRTIEFMLAIATTVITAAMAVVDKETMFGGFDVVALTAVLTTLSGAIVAYIEASRYDFTVQSYRSTARRLKDEVNNPPPNAQPGTPEWSAFVDRCESILREENTGWIAKFSKPV
jgi:hypothetical protein